MRTLVFRLRRHLSYANVMATVAVFLALGGVSYAATQINGKNIVKHSIGAGKLKKKTLGSKQVKKNSLRGSVIDESTLKIVPQARSANTATSASTATSATTAQTAQTATSATTAQTAKTAGVAEEAETLEGMSSEELVLKCPEGTELYGGMCWDETVRPTHSWLKASIECGKAGGRLPTLSEMVAYIARPGTQFASRGWVSDLIETGIPLAVKEEAGGSDVLAASSGEFGYRCLFYRTNS